MSATRAPTKQHGGHLAKPTRNAAMLAAWKTGKTFEQIAGEHGISRQRAAAIVQAQVKAANLPPRETSAFEQRKKAKAQQRAKRQAQAARRRDILAAWVEGATQRKLAKEYGVRQETICAIVKRERAKAEASGENIGTPRPRRRLQSQPATATATTTDTMTA